MWAGYFGENPGDRRNRLRALMFNLNPSAPAPVGKHSMDTEEDEEDNVRVPLGVDMGAS